MVKLVYCIKKRDDMTPSAEGIAAGAELLEDEGHFIDFEASTLFLTEEHEIF